MADSGTIRSTPRKLYRRPDDGHLGGVCAGLAEYLDVDPALVRIATVVLAFTGPGVPAYILAWIFLPAGEGTAAPAVLSERPNDRRTRMVGVVLIGLALSVLWGDWWSPARRWMVPVGLIGVGAWLLLRRDQEDPSGGPTVGDGPIPTAPGSPPSTWSNPAGVRSPVASTPPDPGGATEPPAGGPGTDPATAVDPGVEDIAAGAGTGPDTTTELEGGAPDPPGGDTTSTSADGPPPPTPVGVVRSRRHRFVGPLVFGALLVWGGLAWLAGVAVEDGLAIGLCILGAGFVLGAFVGGSRALILPALVVAGALAVTSIVDVPWGGGIGTKRWEAAAPGELRRSYELGIGEGTLDLRDLDLEGRGGGTFRATVDVGVGHLVVLVPEGAPLLIDGHVGMGELTVLGYQDDGVDIDVRRMARGRADHGTLALDLNLGIGNLEVRRVG